MHPGVIIGALIIIALALWAAVARRSLLLLSGRVEALWLQIDVELHRRRQLIPILIDTLGSQAAADLAEARCQAQRAPSRAQAEREVSAALHRALVEGEHMGAAGPFYDIKAEVAAIEERIVVDARSYNEAVAALNTKLASLPLIAAMSGIRPAAPFEVPGVQADVQEQIDVTPRVAL